MYLAYAAFYEGPSDAQYFDVLIFRVLEDLILKYASRAVDLPETPSVRLGANGRTVEAVATEICASRKPFAWYSSMPTREDEIWKRVSKRDPMPRAFCLNAESLSGIPLFVDL